MKNLINRGLQHGWSRIPMPELKLSDGLFFKVDYCFVGNKSEYCSYVQDGFNKVRLEIETEDELLRIGRKEGGRKADLDENQKDEGEVVRQFKRITEFRKWSIMDTNVIGFFSTTCGCIAMNTEYTCLLSVVVVTGDVFEID